MRIHDGPNFKKFLLSLSLCKAISYPLILLQIENRSVWISCLLSNEIIERTNLSFFDQFFCFFASYFSLGYFTRNINFTTCCTGSWPVVGFRFVDFCTEFRTNRYDAWLYLKFPCIGCSLARREFKPNLRTFEDKERLERPTTSRNEVID